MVTREDAVDAIAEIPSTADLLGDPRHGNQRNGGSDDEDFEITHP
jgi:hypothetical protein